MGFSDHFFVKDKYNRFYGWGRNDDGQLGVNHVQHSIPCPVPIDAVTIGLGVSHSIVLNKDGKVETAGWNEFGQLGTSDQENRLNFEVIQLDKKVRTVGTGAAHSMFITENFETFAFGKNEFGQLGLGDVKYRSAPTQVNTKEKFQDILCGAYHNFFVDRENKYFGCGSNTYGELCTMGQQVNQLKPVLIQFKLHIKVIYPAWNCTFILNYKNILYSIGRKFSQDSPENPASFVEIPCPSGYYVHLEPGRYHCLALNQVGELFAFGSNQNGQLAITAEGKFFPPTLIKFPEQISFFWCGYQQSFIVSKSGKVYSVGYNHHYQLGVPNETKNRFLLKEIENLVDIVPMMKFSSFWKKYFKIFYFAHSYAKNMKCIWKRVPVEIIKEICKFI